MTCVPVFTVSLLLAAALGFAAHRAGICTVKAVAEIVTTRRVHMLASFGKTILWVMLVTMVLTLLVPPPAQAGQTGWALSGYALLGGAVFGMGAALNRGCAVSSLSRLMDGELAMAATLLGMLFGATAEIVLAVNAVVPKPLPAAAAIGPGASWLPVALAGLALWALWETSRIARAHGPAGTVRARIAAERYRLSTAAALIGVCNAALFFIFGTWIFTGALIRTVTGLVGGVGTPTAMLWGLFAAVLAGMMVSSVQRGSFSLRRPQAGRAAIHFTAGALMGFGAALAPGGNDALILDTIPGLSPHAVPTFLAMLAGIVAGLGVMRLFGGTIPPVHCTGDICVSD